jgi:ABC-type amino acid transport substrate-binding protein
MRPFARRLFRRSSLRVLAPAAVLVAALVLAAGLVVGQLREPRASTPRPVLVASGSWAPFVGPDLPDGGPLVELVTEVLRSRGYSPEVGYTSWSQAERRARAGDAIGVFPLVGSAGRGEDLLRSDPLLDFEYVLFYDRSRPEPLVTGPADLATLRVGRIAGYDYWPELESAVPAFVEYPSSLDAFRALARGEIDLLPEGLLSGNAVLADPALASDAQGFGYLDGPEPLVRSTQGLYFMMPRTREADALLRDFDAGLADFRTTDAYAAIVGELTSGTSADPVSLVPAGSDGLVELRDADGTPVLLTPRGTRARVLEWPAAFLTGSSGRPDPEKPVLVRVKLTNGPAVGRVFSVDARDLVLPESD